MFCEPVVPLLICGGYKHFKIFINFHSIHAAWIKDRYLPLGQHHQEICLKYTPVTRPLDQNTPLSNSYLQLSILSHSA